MDHHNADRQRLYFEERFGINKLSDKYMFYRCSQCEGIFAKEDMLKYETLWICADCKLALMQKIKEGMEITPNTSNTIGWKIFFFIFLIYELFGYTLLIQQIRKTEIGWVSILDLIVIPLTIIALFGFSLEKKIWNRIIWKVLFPISMLTDVIEIESLLSRNMWIGYIIVLYCSLLIDIFKYIALYRYAFSKRKPWL